jgi:hypothetical protein
MAIVCIWRVGCIVSDGLICLEVLRGAPNGQGSLNIG